VLKQFDRRSMVFGAAGMGLAGLAYGASNSNALEAAVLGLGGLDDDDKAPSNDGLRKLADQKGLLLGAAVVASQLRSDPQLVAALQANANVIVPDRELKWSYIEDRPGHYHYEEADELSAFAYRNGMQMRGHTLTWYRSVPDWATAALATATPAAAGDMLEKHIRTVVSRWKGRLIHWDAANESVDDKGKLTDVVWAPKLGETYLDIAFKAAHAADPQALLLFNTDVVEMEGKLYDERRAAVLALLQRLLKRGVPVQAVGIEGHLLAGGTFSQASYRKFLDAVVGMGLKFIVTEMDISDRGVFGFGERRDAEVAAMGKAFLDVNFSYRQCLGMLTWSITDKYSWLRQEKDLQRIDGSPLRPGLLDDTFAKKPLWNAVADAIRAAPARSKSA
jgi:endo-1,4-beta-xylanase